MEKVIIIGGGLAGLISSVYLAKNNVSSIVIERKRYPFHRVCGEYISNEAVPFLNALGVYPKRFAPAIISRCQLSSIEGKNCTLSLDLGGFGISRYTYDAFLFDEARRLGVEFILDTEVQDVRYTNDHFIVYAGANEIRTNVVIGSFGKRSRLDIKLNRNFIRKRSPFVGIKYHVRTTHPPDVVALHNFEGGYCGVCQIEAGKTNLCYLTHKDNVRKFRNIHEMEEQVLFRNPLIRSIFTNSTFLFDKPETVNEISFEAKNAVENHMLMVGDAAGMIAPLCGNGMAMAIHAAKVACEWTVKFVKEKRVNRQQFEAGYEYDWKKHFSRRIWAGRQVQKLFGASFTSSLAVDLAVYSRVVANIVIRSTHGDTF